MTGIANAIACEQQLGDLPLRDRVVAEQAWNHDASTHVTVTSSHHHHAAGLADVIPLELRAGAAPHLAVALQRHGTLAALDHGHAEAARILRAAAHLVS